MKIYVFDFYKDRLSTAQPALSDGREIEVKLKEPCSVLRPVFRLSLAQGTNFNYIRTALAGEAPRFYYVADITFDKSDIIVSCVEDFRASGRDIIMVSEQYIERCSDPLIAGTEKLTDAYYMPGNKVSVDVNKSAKVFGAGFYVLGLAAKGVTNCIMRGGISYVIMRKAQMEAFAETMLGIGISLLSIIKPIDYIYSCVYIPFDLPNGAQDTSDSIQMNDYSAVPLPHVKADSVTSLISSDGMIMKSVTLSIANHPESALGDFVNFAPYKRARMIAGPFGEVDVPLEISGGGVVLKIYCDITDGSAVGDVIQGGHNIMKLRNKIGIPTALAQLSSNMAGLIGSGLSMVSAAGSMLTGNPIGGIVGLASSAASAFSSAVPRPTTTGMNGSYAELYDPYFYMQTECYDVVESNNADVGHLVMKRVALSTIASGSYVKCRDARMIFGGYAEEHDEIIRALNEGVYLI